MSTSGFNSQPWFISITAKWLDAEAFPALRDCMARLRVTHSLPFYHKDIAESSMHSTVLAIVKLSTFPPHGPAADYAKEVFNIVISSPSLPDTLQHIFEPFEARPEKLRCFDIGTTIQFEDSPRIEALRRKFGKELESVVREIQQDRVGVTSLLKDENKSIGKRFFGSIARSVRPSDAPQLRWELDLTSLGLPPLTFDKIHLLVSDDGLTNVHDDGNCFSLRSSQE